LGHEVGDDVVAGPLTEEGHGNDHEQAIARGLGVAQLTEIPPGVLVASGAELFDDFTVLKLNNGVVAVAYSRVLENLGYKAQSGGRMSAYHHHGTWQECPMLLPGDPGQ
jgi:hypothetical protein